MQKQFTFLLKDSYLEGNSLTLWKPVMYKRVNTTCEPQRSVLSQQSHGYPLLYPVQSLAVI